MEKIITILLHYFFCGGDDFEEKVAIFIGCGINDFYRNYWCNYKYSSTSNK